MSTDDHDRTVPGPPDDGATDDGPTNGGPTDDELMAAARRGTERLAQVDGDHVAGLWAGIAVATRPASDDDHAEPTSAPTPRPRTEATTRSSPDAPPRPATDDASGRRGRPASIAQLSEARQRRSVAVALTAVAAVVLAVVGVGWVVTRDEPTPPVASFRMEALDDRAGAPVAGTIVDTDTGPRVEVDLDTLPPPPDGTFYELWLLDLDAGRLVSLGPVEQQDSFAVPAAVDVGDYPTIDVSVEPADGDPTHSSDSVLRGPVTAAAPTD